MDFSFVRKDCNIAVQAFAAKTMSSHLDFVSLGECPLGPPSIMSFVQFDYVQLNPAIVWWV